MLGRFYRSGTALLSAAMVLLGVALLVRGALALAPVGLVLGALFVAAGAGRLYLLRRR
jgi:hypothetical protein